MVNKPPLGKAMTGVGGIHWMYTSVESKHSVKKWKVLHRIQYLVNTNNFYLTVLSFSCIFLQRDRIFVDKLKLIWFRWVKINKILYFFTIFIIFILYFSVTLYRSNLTENYSYILNERFQYGTFFRKPFFYLHWGGTSLSKLL